MGQDKCGEDLETQPFLNDNDRYELAVRDSKPTRFFMLLQGINLFCHPWHWTFHATIIVIYSIIFTLCLLAYAIIPGASPVQLQISAQIPLHRNIRPFPTVLQHNPFTGSPRPELDLAWHNLLRNDNIRVPSSNLARLNLTSIFLSDGSGDLTAQLGVFHALHCLKTIRHFIYQDHYLANATEQALKTIGVHVDHCVEYIRENLMCHPDISLVTHHWTMTDEGRKPSIRDTALHECADWRSLDEWAGKRVVDMYQLDMLKGHLDPS